MLCFQYFLQKSNDRSRMSRQLTVEAEKYFEDFISNVEDTDISSFDGERSDGSSTLGGIIKARDGVVCAETESYQIPVGSDFRPVEMDGVKLPWLKWETSNDGSLSSKTEIKTPPSQKSVIWDAKQVNYIFTAALLAPLCPVCILHPTSFNIVYNHN